MSISLSLISAWSTYLSGNPIYIKGTSTIIPAGATEYKILVKIESVDGEIEGGPWIDTIAPDTNLESLFDISGRVNHFVQKTFNWPLVGFANPHAEMVCDIHVSPGERYINADGDKHETFGTAIEHIFIVKGKLPNHKLAQFNDAVTTWHEYYSVGGKFLTDMPRVQTVSPYQPIKLWYKFTGVTEVEKLGTLTGTFSDGSTAEITQPFDAYSDIIFEFDVSAEHNGFTLNDGSKRLEKFTFTVTGCETFTFNIDWGYYAKYYYLLVDNQLGGIDCHWLRGRGKYEPTGERTISAKPQPKGSGVKIPTLTVSGNTRQRRWVINSGYKPDMGEMEALESALDSPYSWLLLPPADGDRGWNNENYEVIPVIVTNNKLALRNDKVYGMDNDDLEIIEAH